MFRVKKIFATFGFAIILGTASAPAHALITANPPQLIAQISENIGNAITWGKEKMMMIGKMDLEGMLGKMGIDASNNGFVNLIARSGRMQEELEDLELLEKMMPDRDMCGNVGLARYQDMTDCASREQVRNRTYEASVDNMRFGLKGDAFNNYAKNKVNNMIEVCKQFTSVDPSQLETEEQRLQYSDCFQVGKIYGGGTTGTLSMQESAAMDQSIKIMTNAVPREKKSARMNKGTTEYNVRVLQESRKELYRNLAISSLHEVKGWVAPPGKIEDDLEAPSKLEGLQAWLDARDASWIMEVGGGETKKLAESRSNASDKEAKKMDRTIYPSELARKSLEIDRWRAQLQFYQFQGGLRKEALTAAMLSIMSDPL